MLDSLFDLANTPIGNAAAAPCLRDRLVRIESQLVTADVEADIERLIEVGLLLEGLRIPRFGLVQIGDVVDDCGKSFHHWCLRSITCYVLTCYVQRAACHVLRAYVLTCGVAPVTCYVLHD